MAKEIVRRYREQAPLDDDPQNSGIAIAVGVAAAATAYGAYSASESQKKANEANKQNVADTNALNYQMFLQSRGSEGNALLPMYMPQGTEAALGQQAIDTYLAEQAAMGTPAEQIQAYKNIVAGMTPAMNQSDALVNQLFSGELEKQQLANIQPVLAARGEVATAQKKGILEGLTARLNALSADRARAGYQGGGSAFEKARLTGATIPALQQAGTVGAQADVANASDVAAVKNAAINTRLQNLNLPMAQAANKIQLQQLPQTATTNALNTSMQPFNFFKLNPSVFQAAQSPLVQPVLGAGAVIGAGLGSGASTLGNYFAMQQLANQMKPQSNPFTLDQYAQQQNMVNQSSFDNSELAFQLGQSYGF